MLQLSFCWWSGHHPDVVWRVATREAMNDGRPWPDLPERVRNAYLDAAARRLTEAANFAQIYGDYPDSGWPPAILTYKDLDELVCAIKQARGVIGNRLWRANTILFSLTAIHDPW